MHVYLCMCVCVGSEGDDPHHAYVGAYTRPCVCPYATHMHPNTHSPISSLFTSYPLPLTLPHTHKIRLNYPGVLSPARIRGLLFVQREHFLFFSCAPPGYHCLQALTPQLCLQVFLSFFVLPFPFHWVVLQS